MADEKSSSGIGITGIVFIVFLVLKLAEIGTVATWSWWWIFSPLWIHAILFIVILIISALLAIFRK